MLWWSTFQLKFLKPIIREGERDKEGETTMLYSFTGLLTFRYYVNQNYDKLADILKNGCQLEYQRSVEECKNPLSAMSFFL